MHGQNVFLQFNSPSLVITKVDLYVVTSFGVVYSCVLCAVSDVFMG